MMLCGRTISNEKGAVSVQSTAGDRASSRLLWESEFSEFSMFEHHFYQIWTRNPEIKKKILKRDTHSRKHAATLGESEDLPIFFEIPSKEEKNCCRLRIEDSAYSHIQRMPAATHFLGYHMIKLDCERISWRTRTVLSCWVFPLVKPDLEAAN